MTVQWTRYFLRHAGMSWGRRMGSIQRSWETEDVDGGCPSNGIKTQDLHCYEAWYLPSSTDINFHFKLRSPHAQIMYDYENQAQKLNSMRRLQYQCSLVCPSQYYVLSHHFSLIVWYTACWNQNLLPVKSIVSR
jgi:hypothetical protein